MVLSTLVLAGCGVAADVYVKKYEGENVEVEACHKTGERITAAGTYPDNAEEGESTDEVWRCAIKERASNAGSVDKCYVLHESKVETIVRGVKCSSGG
jgi:hypothetical protein